MKKGLWFALSLVVVLIDQFSKYWAEAALIPYQPLPVFPMFNLTLAYNSGAAFSFLSGAGGWHRWFFAGFSAVMSIILIVWLFRTSLSDKLQSAGVSLILGGAVGNLIDRSIQGYVIDFIDFYYEYHHFATFNIADSAITLGVFFLILDALWPKKLMKSSEIL